VNKRFSTISQKFRKERLIVKSRLSGCLTVCPHRKTRMSVDGFWSIYRKPVEKIQVPFKTDKNNLKEGPCTLLIISRLIPLRMRNVADRSCRGDQNTHFVFNNFFFPPRSAVYKIMVEKYCTVRQATDGTMAQALYMLDNYCYTHTLFTMCNTYCFSTTTKVSRTRLSVTLYVRCLSRSLCELWGSRYDHDEYSYIGCDALCCGGTFLQNSGRFLPDYTVSHLRTC